ncbi:pilus assembly PilX family protein [Billgrantia montanilacus]|uniref:Type 4 fimbrial biogenesis protein PilX N-terminal domain-containing protein n=1 Tax=Billgrantia montanilacus TaxID=2282305 RepID=A0A368U005_9GAMM|nr:pilus assembly PilX N-terminal domain-containing protein [Halomonas montanilacus]RCV89392.1 hypothetical protein DU505_10120 [Halomonas montanilacus]
MTGTKQQGAALIMVLVLMTSSLMLGLSAMQGSLINERLAGNYRATAQAQMAAESAAVELSNYLLQLQTTPSNVTSVLATLPFHDGLLASQSDWAPCRGELRWEADAVSPLNLTSGRARLLPCRDEDNGDAPRVLIEGQAGHVDTPAVYTALMALDPLFSPSGLAATNFIGGIAADADIQWPSSRQSRIGATDEHGNSDPNWPAVYFDHLQGEDFAGIETLSKAELIASMSDIEKVLDGDPQDVIVQASPSPGDLDTMIDFLKNVYETCSAPVDENDNKKKNKKGGEAICEHIMVVAPGESDKLKGNTTFEGLYITLGGELDVRGNADIRGSAIVANITIEDDGSWTSNPNETIKLAGGGNKGTVWFDAWHVNKAIEELQQKAPELFAELDMETFWGAGGSTTSGFLRDGWMQEFW